MCARTGVRTSAGYSALGVGNVVRFPWRPASVAGLSLLIVLGLAGHASASEVLRKELEPGIYALAKDGRTLGIELRTSAASRASSILSKYLLVESGARAYEGRSNAFVPLAALKPERRREVLLEVFAQDVVDDRGWLHTAAMDGETLWSICTWITGNGKTYTKVLEHPTNSGLETRLFAGEKVLIPRELLSAVMRRPTPTIVREIPPELADLQEGLRYGSDAEGAFAIYPLKKGETLYGSVVARFTDIRDNADIHAACKVIARRSGIRDVRDIDAGQNIHIPIELLADNYMPAGSPERKQYDAVLLEAERLAGEHVRSKDLSDVVVILDSGHGGQDAGATHAASGLYEDELNYDIVCRIRNILLKETGAKVYVTMLDRSRGLEPTSASRFQFDQDEELMTTPRHRNTDGASVSVNLRWMLVNSIYQKELARGTDYRKIIFTSIHTDSLYDTRLRGAMVYIPGAKNRRSEELRTGAVYARYEEGRSYNHFTSSSAERQRDEALSRNFAVILLDELGKKRIKRHDSGSAIRAQIRRSKTRVFVPAVIRNTKVPTKILVETANLKNATDRKRLADPWWREQFAKAYVDALKRYYGDGAPTKVAWTD